VHNAMLGALPLPKDDEDGPEATIPGSRSEDSAPAADELDIPDFLKEGQLRERPGDPAAEHGAGRGGGARGW